MARALRSEDRQREDEASFSAWPSGDVQHVKNFELVTTMWESSGSLASSIKRRLQPTHGPSTGAR